MHSMYNPIAQRNLQIIIIKPAIHGLFYSQLLNDEDKEHNHSLFGRGELKGMKWKEKNILFIPMFGSLFERKGMNQGFHFLIPLKP